MNLYPSVEIAAVITPIDGDVHAHLKCYSVIFAYFLSN